MSKNIVDESTLTITANRITNERAAQNAVCIKWMAAKHIGATATVRNPDVPRTWKFTAKPIGTKRAGWVSA